MTIKTDFPYQTREIEHCWITLSDGCRLAARIWLPVDADEQPVPAILEYIPYGKNDLTALRDSIHHPYFAGHGYACVRVDLRGCGESDGIMYDEYLPQEQEDGLEVLRWIAAQAWCTGNVGMIGKSWGGFNALQIAAHQPPELKAVMTLCSTDDRYADDVHYMGGCVLASDMLIWASIMLVYNGRPPDPRLVGSRWRQMWLERLEKTPAFIEAWLTHQRRDAFWKQGSVCEDYSNIICPVYAVGGWADGYRNSIFRLMEGLSVPRKALIGPWSHEYPEVAVPDPKMGFLQECLRWWDHWLKGIDTNIMQEPMLRAWMQERQPPATHYTYRPGRWVGESAWPSATIQEQRYWLNTGTLDNEPTSEKQIAYLGDQTHGLDAGVWWSYGKPGDMPSEQRIEDGKALCFTSAALTEPVELLGFPDVTLTIAVDQPNALLAVRLCDIAPTGSSALVSRGLLNLTHRDSHEFPTPLEPGKRYIVTIRLNAIAHVLPAGHRWRLAISPTYWPHAWPSPKPVTVTLFTGQNSHLSLPTRPPQAEDEDLTPFAPPEHAARLPHHIVRPATRKRTVHRDLISGAHQLVDNVDDGHIHLIDSGLEFESLTTDTFNIMQDDPLSASVQCERTLKMGRDEWRIQINTSSHMSADAHHFHVTNTLDAYEGNTRIFTKSSAFRVPRDMV